MKHVPSRCPLSQTATLCTTRAGGREIAPSKTEAGFTIVVHAAHNLSAHVAVACHFRHGWARPCPGKMPVTAVYVMNHDALPTFEAARARIDVVSLANGRKFCGRPDRHPYELFLQLKDIEHRATKVNRPQSNGIVDRLHRTLLDEHFRVEGRRT